MSGRTTPNRGTTRSFRYAVFIGGGGLVLSFAMAFAIRQTVLDHEPIPPLIVFIGTAGCIAALLGFGKGGLFALRHYLVRLFLWFGGHAPLRYVRFLNECTDRLFLIRRGGSYEFFHITFRDFMAKEYGPKG